MRPEAQQVLNRDVLINSFKSPGNLKIRARLEAGLSREQILIHISGVKVEKPPRLHEESKSAAAPVRPPRALVTLPSWSRCGDEALMRRL